jgi:hypothetical protein
LHIAKTAVGSTCHVARYIYVSWWVTPPKKGTPSKFLWKIVHNLFLVEVKANDRRDLEEEA